MHTPSFRLLPFALLVVFLALGAGCSKTARRDRLLAQADRSFAAGRFDDAEIAYLNALQAAPDNAVAISRLGIVYFDQGRLSRAAPYLLRARDLQVDDPDVCVRVASLLLAGGKTAEARAAAELALARRPRDPDAPVLVAEASATPAERAATRSQLEALRGTAAETASVHVALGLLALRENRPEAAEPAYRKALQVDAQSSFAHAALGNLLLAKGDSASAADAFARAAESAPPRSSRKLLLARFKLQAGDLPAARQALEAIIRQSPDYLPALTALADVAFLEKKLPEAAGLLERVLARDATQFEALLLRGRLRLAQGEPEPALADFERAKTLFPKSPQAHYHFAMATLGRGKTQEAVTALGQAVALDPLFPEAASALAGLAMLRGDFSSAIGLLQPLVQRRPQLARPQLLLADAYRGRGDFDEALRIYRAQEKTQPKTPELPLMQGLVLLKQGKPAEAAAAFERALAIAPDFPPALEQLYGLALKDKQLEPFAARLDRSIERASPRPELLALRARTALAQADTARAEALLLKALTLKPDFREGYLLLAGLYTTAGRQSAALATLRNSVARNPNDVTAWMMIGMLSEHERDWEGARTAYEKAVAHNGRFVPALNNLAWLCSERFDQVDRAFELARKARDLNANDPQICDTLGWILYRRGDYPWALSLLSESASKLPDSAEIHYHLGMVHYMMGAEDPARAALQRALAMGTAFGGDDQARTALDLLAIDPAQAGPAERDRLEKRLAFRPGDPIALLRLAALQERAGHPDQALESYRSILKATPQNLAALLQLARLTSRTDPKAAMEIARSAYKLAPDDPAVATVLGRLAYRTDEFTWAASLLQQAARKRPADAALAFDLAQALFRTGALAEAEEAARTALAADPGFPGAAEATQFLELLALANQPSRAGGAKIAEALRQQPDSLPALWARAALAESEGDRSTAIATCQKALQRLPDFKPAVRRLALLLAQEDRDNKSTAEWLAKARAAFPADSAIARALGVSAFRTGDFRRAATFLREASTAQPDDAEALFLLGLSCARIKERPAARQALARAMELAPQHPRAAEARTALQELQ